MASTVEKYKEANGRITSYNVCYTKLLRVSVCFMNDPEVAARANRENVTRALAAVDKAAEIDGPVIYAVGNAPTALLRLLELVKRGRVAPELIVGMPVGFV